MRFVRHGPPDSKYAHRAGDAISGAHSPMKLVNPPVAWMLHAGAPRLLDAGVHLPALHDGDRTRVALEAYPGLAMRTIAAQAGHGARAFLQERRAGQADTARRDARVLLLDAIVERRLSLRRPDPPVPRALARPRSTTAAATRSMRSPRAVQAAWGAQRAAANYGLPGGLDPLEGWIVTA